MKIETVQVPGSKPAWWRPIDRQQTRRIGSKSSLIYDELALINNFICSRSSQTYSDYYYDV
jgi:hypothetical protein